MPKTTIEPTPAPVAPAKEAVKEPAKEPIKEPVKEPVKEPTPTPVAPIEHKVHIVIEQKPAAEPILAATAQKSLNVTLPKPVFVAPLPAPPMEKKTEVKVVEPKKPPTEVKVVVPPKPVEVPLKDNQIQIRVP